MNKKIVGYGTTYYVEVEHADAKCIVCIAKSISEGFVLLYHGLKNIPKKNDKGKIVFERDKSSGHWQYYPQLVIHTMPIKKQTNEHHEQ
jgi:hypothetical protein